MKIGLYDPYLDTLGGGERYIFTIATSLLPENEVTLFWDDQAILSQAKTRFNLNLDGLEVKQNIFSQAISTLSRAFTSRQFDIFFYISDGSTPLLLSKKVIPIYQFPLLSAKRNSILEGIKNINTTRVLCYSEYVRKFLLKQGFKNPTVLYPAVKSISLRLPRENIILSVGRFTRGNNTKKQELLVDFFLKHKLHFKGWKLVLLGAVLEKDKEYVSDLKKSIGNSPSVEIIENASYSVLCRYYARSKIYWHAAGFEEDLSLHPERAEHFGISIVEAMSAGCVPLVYNGGGPREIVTDGENGFVWNTLTELFNKTKLSTKDSWTWQRLSDNGVKYAGRFSPESFGLRLQTLL